MAIILQPEGRIIMRSAAVITDTPRERIFRCDTCKTALSQPVDKSGLYVLRGNEPLLICPNCALSDDLYIWGDIAYLDRQDWTPEMLKVEQEREHERIDRDPVQTEMEDIRE